jgi:hypothetical protein
MCFVEVNYYPLGSGRYGIVADGAEEKGMCSV